MSRNDHTNLRTVLPSLKMFWFESVCLYKADKTLDWIGGALDKIIGNNSVADCWDLSASVTSIQRSLDHQR